MKPSYLIKGFPGHPLHPPLTDATIGMYSLAAILGVLGAFGVAEESMAKGWWLALIIGLVVNAPTAITGIVDWLEITRWTPLWKTATLHWITMVSATVFFGLAAIFGHDGYADGQIPGGPLVLTLVGFALLTLGGWLGGTIVYVHGMRVLNLVDEPTSRAITPGHPEKEGAAAGGDDDDSTGDAEAPGPGRAPSPER
jgi:uncharacterized membrane protein